MNGGLTRKGKKNLLIAATAALVAAALAPTAASAARYECSSSQPVVIGFGDLASTGPNCTISFPSNGSGVLLSGGSATVSGIGLVSGKVYLSYPGSNATGPTCGPELNSCSIAIPAQAGVAAAVCSMTGSLSVSGSIRCSFTTP